MNRTTKRTILMVAGAALGFALAGVVNHVHAQTQDPAGYVLVPKPMEAFEGTMWLAAAGVTGVSSAVAFGEDPTDVMGAAGVLLGMASVASVTLSANKLGPLVRDMACFERSRQSFTHAAALAGVVAGMLILDGGGNMATGIGVALGTAPVAAVGLKLAAGDCGHLRRAS